MQSLTDRDIDLQLCMKGEDALKRLHDMYCLALKGRHLLSKDDNDIANIIFHNIDIKQVTDPNKARSISRCSLSLENKKENISHLSGVLVQGGDYRMRFAVAFWMGGFIRRDS